MNTGKLNKLQSQVRIGGKGTPRRKVKKTGGSHGAGGAGGMDDLRKVQSCMKKTPIQPIPMIEEVNMFRDDGKIIHFQSPKGKSLLLSLIMEFNPHLSSVKCIIKNNYLISNYNHK